MFRPHSIPTHVQVTSAVASAPAPLHPTTSDGSHMASALSQGLATNWTRVDHSMLTNADGSAIKGGELVVYVVAAQVGWGWVGCVMRLAILSLHCHCVGVCVLRSLCLRACDLVPVSAPVSACLCLHAVTAPVRLAPAHPQGVGSSRASSKPGVLSRVKHTFTNLKAPTHVVCALDVTLAAAPPQHTAPRPISLEGSVSWNERKVFHDVQMRSELVVRLLGQTGLQETVSLGTLRLPLTEVEDLGDLAVAPGPRRFVVEGTEEDEEATVVLQLYWKLNPLSVLTLKVCCSGVLSILSSYWSYQPLLVVHMLCMLCMLQVRRVRCMPGPRHGARVGQPTGAARSPDRAPAAPVADGGPRRRGDRALGQSAAHRGMGGGHDTRAPAGRHAACGGAGRGACSGARRPQLCHGAWVSCIRCAVL